MTAPSERPGIVCLGASAGGLRSLEAIVRDLRADFPWPILISQHLQTDRVSQMPEILARLAHLSVREAIAGETPQPGTIYTCPSASEMGLTMDGLISLRPATAGRPQRIDHLFATASYARPGRTIAVVLSGTGTDGAVGSLVVKLNHGTVVVESDATAQHSAMPAATQRAVTVDAAVPVEAIAPLLEDLARGSLERATAETSVTVERIARAISAGDGTDFTQYRPSTLRRQAERRRAILGLPTLDAYRERIESAAEERAALVQTILIPVTEFFRDPAAWRAVEEQVVPILARRALDGKPVRVWCAGCASGEEAYTIAILLAENLPHRQRVQIVGTDLDAETVASARRGVFDASRMEGVDAMRRERFFRSEGGAHAVSEDLRRMVQFRVHDVTREPPPGQFDLVICRNLLIYFDPELQARVVDTLYQALTGPRLLFLGKSEALPSPQGQFAPLARALRIFRAGGPVPLEVRDRGEHLPSREFSSWSGAADVRVEEADALILIVDEAWNILNANDHARDLMDSELAGTNLLDLFPRWQGSPVHDALRASSVTGRSLKVRGAPTPQGAMDITIEPLPGQARETLLVATPALSRRLDPEVREARDDLLATSDELQSANEELAATNEELQATNEELASLNEEFQSTNQTLASTNVELDEVAKTARAATDLMNEFLQAWRDAMVACDAQQRITLFNRRAAEIFGLDASCIGRPIQLASLGMAAREVDAALRDATLQPTRTTVVPGEDHDMTIEQVQSRAGAPLGWVLTWAAR